VSLDQDHAFIERVFQFLSERLKIGVRLNNWRCKDHEVRVVVHLGTLIWIGRIAEAECSRVGEPAEAAEMLNEQLAEIVQLLGSRLPTFLRRDLFQRDGESV
jgi:hypothetical protein